MNDVAGRLRPARGGRAPDELARAAAPSQCSACSVLAGQVALAVQRPPSARPRCRDVKVIRHGSSGASSAGGGGAASSSVVARAPSSVGAGPAGRARASPRCARRRRRAAAARRRAAAAGPSARSCSVHGSTTSPGGSRRASSAPTPGGCRPASARRRRAGRRARASAPASARGARRRPRRTSTRAARRRGPARPARGRPAGAASTTSRAKFTGAEYDGSRIRSPMAVAPAFYEKTDEQKAIIEMVRQFVDEQIIPQGRALRRRGRVPGADRRADEGARAVRRDDPRGVRRDGARPDDLRDDRRGALARLDLDLAASSTRTSSAPTC